MPDNNSGYFPAEGASPRQQRVAALVDAGYKLAEATGRVFAEDAGYTPPPVAGTPAARPDQDD